MTVGYKNPYANENKDDLPEPEEAPERTAPEVWAGRVLRAVQAGQNYHNQGGEEGNAG